MNFDEWFKSNPSCYEYQECSDAWNSCKNEALKIIKSKYPKYVGDLIYEDGWDTACMSIEEEVEKL